jgi:hypothetical protein
MQYGFVHVTGEKGSTREGGKKEITTGCVDNKAIYVGRDRGALNRLYGSAWRQESGGMERKRHQHQDSYREKTA